jgi:hypothetical protein
MTMLTTAMTAPFRPTLWQRFTAGCLWSHGHPLWRRLNATDVHLYLECPRCGEQRRALEWE